MTNLFLKKITYLADDAINIKPLEDTFLYNDDKIKIKKAGAGDYLILINGAVYFELHTDFKILFINVTMMKNTDFNDYCNMVVKKVLQLRYKFILENWTGSITAGWN